jgi:hypothetical protein
MQLYRAFAEMEVRNGKSMLENCLNMKIDRSASQTHRPILRPATCRHFAA